MPQDWEPEDWAEEQARRVASEIARLRDPHSTQWLSDQTEELTGYRVSRSVIADLENGRRRYVTIAELIVLALALDTPPITLLYPGPYLEGVIRLSPKGPEIPEIVGVEWFSGDFAGVSNVPFTADDDQRLIVFPLDSATNYWERARPLRVARRVRDLDNRRKDILREIARADDAEVRDGLVATAEALKNQIDSELAPRRGLFGDRDGG
jgi:transcriptional regulator with XRE-family HTH domain